MVERRREPVADQAIGEKHGGDDRQRDAHHLPDEIDQDDEGCNSHHHVEMGEFTGAHQQIVVQRPLIEAHGETRDADGPAEDASRRRPGTMIGHHRASDQAQEPHVQGPHHLARKRAAEPDDEAERDRDGEPGQHAIHDASPTHHLQDQPSGPDRHRHRKEMIERDAGDERRVERDSERGDDLEGRKRNGDPEQDSTDQAFAETFREAVLRIDDDRRGFHLGYFRHGLALAHPHNLPGNL